jgi:hypothetical protein
MRTGPDEIDLFVAEFGRDIRVGLNWNRLLKDRWPLSKRLLRDRTDFDACWLPWYLGTEGGEVRYDAVGARPVRLSDIPAVVTNLRMDRQRDVAEYARHFREAEDVIRFSVPAYMVSSSGFVALDRCHRLAALAMDDFQFEVEVIGLEGPLDPECLPDLAVIPRS